MMHSVALTDSYLPNDDEYVMVDARQDSRPSLLEEENDDASYDYCEDAFSVSSSVLHSRSYDEGMSQGNFLADFALPPNFTDTELEDAMEAIQTHSFGILHISEADEGEDDDDHEKSRESGFGNIPGSDSNASSGVEITDQNERRPEMSKTQSDVTLESAPPIQREAGDLLTGFPNVSQLVARPATTTSALYSSRKSNKKRRKQLKLSKKAAAAAAAAAAISQYTQSHHQPKMIAKSPDVSSATASHRRG